MTFPTGHCGRGIADLSDTMRRQWKLSRASRSGSLIRDLQDHPGLAWGHPQAVEEVAVAALELARAAEVVVEQARAQARAQARVWA